jgi:hypothetical protein
MRKQHHRDHTPGLHGWLHVRGRVRHAVIAAACAFLACPTVAAAEVCDKVVGEQWRRGDGPAWALTFPGAFDPTRLPLAAWVVAFGIPLGIALATFWTRAPLPAAIVLKWIGYFVAGLAALFAFFIVRGMIFLQDIDAIHALAAKEGCIVFHHDWRNVLINTGAVTLVILAYGWMAICLKRFELRMEAEHRRRVAT